MQYLRSSFSLNVVVCLGTEFELKSETTHNDLKENKFSFCSTYILTGLGRFLAQNSMEKREMRIVTHSK